MIVPEGSVSRFLSVDGFRIHFFEAGDPALPHLVLLHSCDYGSSAEFSWEHNIPALSEHFHIIAPDWPGYGLSDKFYDFTHGHMAYRLRALRRLLELLCIETADFAGNSCGASILLRTAAAHGADVGRALPVRRMVLCSPSCIGTPGPGRSAIDGFDGSRAAMQRLHDKIFVSEALARDQTYLDRKVVSANRPGHRETIAAASMVLPNAIRMPPEPSDWSRVTVPVLFVNGDTDRLIREKDGGMDSVRGIASGTFVVVPNSGHCTQIEHASSFNRMLVQFLEG